MKFLTPDGAEKIKNELHFLKTSKRQEIAKRLEEAKALGDLAENAEYASAKEAQSFNEGRIMELEQLLKEAAILDPQQQQKQNGKNIISIGSVFEVKSLDKRIKSPKEEYTIVSSQEADPLKGKISNESPLGKAFIGHTKNEIIEVETPSGVNKYQILNIK
jgi:transcription elongation factor GreA